MSSWWPKSTGKDDDKPAAVAVTQSQSLSVVASGSQPGSAPPSLPQSPSARRGVNLLDEVVRLTSSCCVIRDVTDSESNGIRHFFEIRNSTDT